MNTSCGVTVLGDYIQCSDKDNSFYNLAIAAVLTFESLSTS